MAGDRPISRSSTGSPASASVSTSAGSPSRVGWGASMPSDGASRRMPTSRCSSSTACRAEDSTVPNASAARSGSFPMTCRAAAACTPMTLTWWATTSCSSRAIRTRSATTACCALASRSVASCSARRDSSARSIRWWRSRSPSTHAAT